MNAFQFHCSKFLKKRFSNPGKGKALALFVILKSAIAVSLFLGVACW
jgi:hypothetical protein